MWSRRCYLNTKRLRFFSTNNSPNHIFHDALSKAILNIKSTEKITQYSYPQIQTNLTRLETENDYIFRIPEDPNYFANLKISKKISSKVLFSLCAPQVLRVIGRYFDEVGHDNDDAKFIQFSIDMIKYIQYVMDEFDMEILYNESSVEEAIINTIVDEFDILLIKIRQLTMKIAMVTIINHTCPLYIINDNFINHIYTLNNTSLLPIYHLKSNSILTGDMEGKYSNDINISTLVLKGIKSSIILAGNEYQDIKIFIDQMKLIYQRLHSLSSTYTFRPLKDDTSESFVKLVGFPVGSMLIKVVKREMVKDKEFFGNLSSVPDLLEIIHEVFNVITPGTSKVTMDHYPIKFFCRVNEAYPHLNIDKLYIEPHRGFLRQIALDAETMCSISMRDFKY